MWFSEIIQLAAESLIFGLWGLGAGYLGNESRKVTLSFLSAGFGIAQLEEVLIARGVWFVSLNSLLEPTLSGMLHVIRLVLLGGIVAWLMTLNRWRVLPRATVAVFAGLLGATLIWQVALDIFKLWMYPILRGRSVLWSILREMAYRLPGDALRVGIICCASVLSMWVGWTLAKRTGRKAIFLGAGRNCSG